MVIEHTVLYTNITMNNNLQKGRSILLTLLESLDQQDTNVTRQISFRDRDLIILRQECQQKYQTFSKLIQQKEVMRRRILELKEQLCELNPEALEEMERDCEKNAISEEVVKEKPPPNKPIKKRNDKKKKRKERIYYD